jgi:2-keto-4-pentenoate hydratase/2-oxohepta-3-ene-1,7-dioic acid hydratase in catechol pathway
VRLARFEVEGKNRIGFVDGREFVEVDSSWTGLLAYALDGLSGVEELATGARFALDSGRLLAPLEDTSRGVFCIGLNYRQHVEEVGDVLGEVRTGRPPIFLKLAASMLGPSNPLVLDQELSKEMDWEVELGVVLGRGGRRIPTDRVGEHVVGYTVIVDTTTRDLQREHVQWFIGKNSHRASPIGPWVTTVDEVGFPPVIELSLHLNGVEKQRATTDLMIWSIAEFVAITSESIELKAGDIFATGSPPGVGFTRQPPEFLTPGDKLRAAIEGVGTLEHAVE